MELLLTSAPPVEDKYALGSDDASGICQRPSPSHPIQSICCLSSVRLVTRYFECMIFPEKIFFLVSYLNSPSLFPNHKFPLLSSLIQLPSIISAVISVSD